MKVTTFATLIFLAAFSACVSPETQRSRGGTAGADVGNRGQVLKMHEGAEPFYKTPQIIGARHAPLESATQAEQLSRR